MGSVDNAEQDGNAACPQTNRTLVREDGFEPPQPKAYGLQPLYLASDCSPFIIEAEASYIATDR